MKILVPIDGSDQSERALEYAVRLQQQLVVDNIKDNNKNTPKKEIIILNVVPHFHIPLGLKSL